MNIKITNGALPVALAALATMTLAACGGGSGGGAPTPDNPVTPPPGPSSVGVVGTITGFGSVYVKGIRYEVTQDTVVAIEGEQETLGDDSRLRLGMKVEVEAEDDNGARTALRIEFDEDLRGPIDTITTDAGDPDLGSFEFAGIVVGVDGNTAYDDDIGDNDGVPGIDLRDLVVGMVVEVSGFPTDSGFLATRVDRDVDGAGNDPEVGRPDVDDDEIEVKGFVESIASDNASITVRGVDFLVDGNTIFEDGLMLNDDLVGVFVEVKADIVNGEYVAVRVEREDDFDDDDRNDEFEIEGVLQSVDTGVTPNTFTINGITVPVVDASSLEGLVGMRVEIEGVFNADRVLVLRQAGQEVEDNLRTEDLVAEVDIAAPSFTTRLGLVVTPTGASRVEDDAADGEDHLTAAAFVNLLQIGDRIEARGRIGSDDSVAWSRVERDETAARNDDFECELRGPVEAIDGDASSFSFEIRGVTVLTDSVQENNFEGANDEAIGRAAFFERLATGVIVEAESFEGDMFCMNGTLDARELELEDDDG